MHSLKSSSRNLGANSLASLMEQMENTARNKELKTFENEFPQLYEDYNQVRDKLLQYQTRVEQKSN